MSSDGTIIITDVGHAKINLAVAAQTKVEITHVAMGGMATGAVYTPGYGQIALKRELARNPIKSRHIGGDAIWRLTAEFDADTTPPVFWVREIGFFRRRRRSAVSLGGGPDVDAPRQTGAIDYLLDHVLALDRIKDGGGGDCCTPPMISCSICMSLPAVPSQICNLNNCAKRI